MCHALPFPGPWGQETYRFLQLHPTGERKEQACSPPGTVDLSGHPRQSGVRGLWRRGSAGEAQGSSQALLWLS